MLSQEDNMDSSLLLGEQKNLQKHVNMLIQLISIDDHVLASFGCELIDSAEKLFCGLLNRKLPARKIQQQSYFQTLTYCFYCMLAQKKLQNLTEIQICYQQNLKKAHYLTQKVILHQKLRKWANKLQYTYNITQSIEQLTQIKNQLKSTQFTILKWKSEICMLVGVAMCQKNITRNDIVSMLKLYKQLKKDGSLNLRLAARAFVFLIEYLIRCSSQLYTFFQSQLQQILRLLSQQSLKAQVTIALEKCQKFLSKTLQNTTQVQFKTFQKQTSRTNNKISVRQGSRATVINRLARNKDDQLFRKVDHFLQTRMNIRMRSNSIIKQQKSSQNNKVSKTVHCSLSNSKRTLKSAFSLNLDWLIGAQAQKGLSQKRMTSQTRIQVQRRNKAYKRIRQQDNKDQMITSTQLKYEIFDVDVREEERCGISLADILLGLTSKENQDLGLKFIGAQNETDFGELKLTFFTIFNQELACLQVTITKTPKSEYLISCMLQSTYSPLKVPLMTSYIQQQSCAYDQFFGQVCKSTIYYEAMQQRVQRIIPVHELQGNQQLFRGLLGISLSQKQLQKILHVLDMVQSQFFWYYTKGVYMNGSRLQKRPSIEFQDLSAFAVSLGKFKSDYDCCLKQIAQVQNVQSLVQTCVYLAQGRTHLHTAFRRHQGRLVLQLVTISDKVYPSFKAGMKKEPQFSNNMLCRKMFDLEVRQQEQEENTMSLIDMGDILPLDGIFMFFMKNIVENYYELRSIRKIQRYLRALNIKQNEDYQIYSKAINPPQCRIRSHQQNTQQEKQQFLDLENIQCKQVIPHLHPSLQPYLRHLTQFVQCFNLVEDYSIQSFNQYFFQFGSKKYIGQQTVLKNSIHLLKIFNKNSRHTYSLLLYINPEPLFLIDTPFRKRPALGTYKVNLIRLQQPQPYTRQFLNVARFVKRQTQCFLIIAVYEQLNMYHRIDIYCPQSQTVFSTVITQFLGSQMTRQKWNSVLRSGKIDFRKKRLLLNRHNYRLWQGFRRMELPGQSFQLIDLQGELCFLISKQDGQLCISKIFQMPFAYSKHIFSSTSNRHKIQAYNNIMVRMYKQLSTGKIASQPMSPSNLVRHLQLLPLPR